MPTENDFETELIKPVQVIKVGKGHYFIDFGKAYFGKVILRSKKKQKDSLIVHLGEKLNKEKRIDKKPGGTIRYQKVTLNQLEANTDVEVQIEKLSFNNNE